MTITADATGTPIGKAQGNLRFVDENGSLTQHGAQLLNGWREFITGINRVIPCNASTVSNKITLTPLDSGPVIEKYVCHEIFAFKADDTSTNSVTATVVPRTGELATLKVYIDGGASQAGNGDVVADRIYLAIFADHLDGGNGALVLK